VFEQFSLHFESKIKIISDVVTKSEQCVIFLLCRCVIAFMSTLSACFSRTFQIQ
jgi:hypothetical protein